MITPCSDRTLLMTQTSRPALTFGFRAKVPRAAAIHSANALLTTAVWD